MHAFRKPPEKYEATKSMIRAMFDKNGSGVKTKKHHDLTTKRYQFGGSMKQRVKTHITLNKI